MPVNDPKIPINKTDYIPHSLIKEIGPSQDRFNDVLIYLKDSQLFFTSKRFTIDSSGITGDFFSFP